ncbi:MAG: hypothetical protein C4576_28600 [Desulfobacteraceae bacterium]|nr:MAG: hypothetical protein C4576_28600 [Desulfobacteraceae bacterium]
MKQVQLNDVAFARSGDKGDVCTVGVMAKSKAIYNFLAEAITPKKVKEFFKGVVEGGVEIYPMPNIDSLEIILRRSLGGGATCTLRFDQTGKSMCCAMLRMELEVEDRLIEEAKAVDASIAKKYGEGRELGYEV